MNGGQGKLFFTFYKTLSLSYILRILRMIRLSLTNWSLAGPCLGWRKVQVKTQICHLTKLEHLTLRVMVYYQEVPVLTWNPPCHPSLEKEVIMNRSRSSLQDHKSEVQVLNQSFSDSGWKRTELSLHQPTTLNKVVARSTLEFYFGSLLMVLKHCKLRLIYLMFCGF